MKYEAKVVLSCILGCLLLITLAVIAQRGVQEEPATYISATPTHIPRPTPAIFESVSSDHELRFPPSDCSLVNLRFDNWIQLLLALQALPDTSTNLSNLKSCNEKLALRVTINGYDEYIVYLAE